MNIVQQFKYNNSNDYELIRGSKNKLLNLYKSVFHDSLENNVFANFWRNMQIILILTKIHLKFSTVRQQIQIK